MARRAYRSPAAPHTGARRVMASSLLLLLGAALSATACAVDDCASPCVKQSGVWRPSAGCVGKDLAALRWQVTIAAVGSSCTVTAAYCDLDAVKTVRMPRECRTSLASVSLGTALCAVKVTDQAVTATCRDNGQVCELAFVRETAPSLSCQPPDAATDAPADAAGEPFESADAASEPPFDAGADATGDGG